MAVTWRSVAVHDSTVTVHRSTSRCHLLRSCVFGAGYRARVLLLPPFICASSFCGISAAEHLRFPLGHGSLVKPTTACRAHLAKESSYTCITCQNWKSLSGTSGSSPLRWLHGKHDARRRTLTGVLAAWARRPELQTTSSTFTFAGERPSRC